MGEKRKKIGATWRSSPVWLKGLTLRPLIAIVIAAGALLYLWLGGESQETPVTEREQRVALSDQEQMELGEEEYQKTLAEEQENIVAEGRRYALVQRVARRVIAVAAEDKPAFEWEVTLIREKEANAWCLPGGKIVVYTGILPYTQDAAGLATVMAHEVAHATAEHGAERTQQQKMTEVASAILAGGIAVTPEQYVQVVALLGAGARVGVTLPWSRKLESEADHIGLVYMARAAYDPNAAVEFWERMSQEGGEEPPEFLSDHPTDENRVEQIEGWLPEAEREYAAATDES
ncbi:MAG TPA: M48 family metallopeptidase [Gaiellaceae bacterium]|jgi:predicted Zn-dependent protease|nr:M48 family metallopeptidase [Gaiellaceae bacterium]